MPRYFASGLSHGCAQGRDRFRTFGFNAHLVFAVVYVRGDRLHGEASALVF